MRSHCAWIWLFAMVLLALPLKAAHGQLIIEPAYVEVRLDKGRPTGQFIITNSGKEEQRYRVLTSHFTFTRDGSLKRLEPDGSSLIEWLKLNPKEFTLPANSRRAIRFVVVPPANLAAGEYWGAMELESLDHKIGQGNDAGGRTMKLEVISSILVPIFGVTGEVEYKGHITEVTMQGTPEARFLQVTVINEGGGRLRLDGTFTVLDAAGKKVAEGPLARSYVLPKCEQRFAGKLPPDLPEGDYTVRAEMHCEQLRAPLSTEQKTQLKIVNPAVSQGEPAPATKPS